MTEAKFEVIDWVVTGNTLLERARQQLSVAPSEKIRNLSNRIPSSITPPKGEVEVVFAGQYSAGKSTILKALTRREDIVTGAAITTQEINSYDWNGLKVFDTPGVHTELRPDHDEISYRAVSQADLLVFVVTNELFDSHLAQHFRKLAIEKDKSHEMMLVVNKMRRCVKGNSPEMQAIILEDLRKVLTPYSPEDLRTCFIDAETAIESKFETDEYIAKILWRKSGMESFVNALNSFVRDKGISGRYTTALYNLEQVLQEALSAESTGDEDIDALEELLLQRRRALLETQDRIPRAVEAEIQRTGTQIRQTGRKIADLIHGSFDQKHIDEELQEAQNQVQEYTEKLNQSIDSVISNHMKDLGDRIFAIANNELANELIPRLEYRIRGANISRDALLKMNNTGNISQQLGKFLIQKSFSLKSGFNGLFNLNHYSGTATHGTVKSIGKLLNYKFRPWEAVKWTRGIANAGRAFAVVGTVLTFVLQVKEDTDAAQLEIDLRESRVAVRSGFNEAAHQIEMHFDEVTGTYIAQTLTKDIEDVDNQLAELREMQLSRSNLYTNLFDLLEETRNMIRRLHTNQSGTF